MIQSYDVIIVGAGSMGMSAGYHLARRGVRTLLIDAFDPPHREGSHHGEPRLIRHAYGGHPVYTELAVHAHRLWNELEDQAETQLLVQSGVLNMADPKLHNFHGRLAEAAKHGVTAVKLNADEVRRRWPGLAIPDHFEAMFEPAAGYLRSEACVDAYKRLALAYGAELLTHSAVTGITARRGSVVVHTRNGKFHGAAAILTAGAWFGTLAPFVSIPVRAVRKTVGWFETAGPDYKVGRFPGFTLHTEEGGFYGFPDIGGAGLNEEQAKWKPAPQIWSVQEVASHLVDHSFVISFRIRDILAGTAARLPAFDQDAWVSGQHSNEGRLSDILDAFHAILEYNALLIGRLSEEELEKTGVNFKGESVSIKAIIRGFVRHVQGHLGQIERIRQAAALALEKA